MNRYKKHKPIGIKFRLDLLMVKQLKKEARQRDTSTNAEIRRRLQWSFDYEEFIAQERQRHAIPSKHDAANVSHQPNAISEKRNTEG